MDMGWAEMSINDLLLIADRNLMPESKGDKPQIFFYFILKINSIQLTYLLQIFLNILQIDTLIWINQNRVENE